MKQNWTFSSIGKTATYVYLVAMTCKIFSHDLELEGSQKKFSLFVGIFEKALNFRKTKW